MDVSPQLCLSKSLLELSREEVLGLISQDKTCTPLNPLSAPPGWLHRG